MLKSGYSTPMFHVTSVERSIAFYKLLGFEVIDTAGCGPINWARLHCQGGAIMLLLSEEPVHPAGDVSLSLYTEDLPKFREQLLAAGVDAPAIDFPDYIPKGHIALRDPDGYPVFVIHWDDQDHAEWLKRIGRTSVY